MKIIPIASGKGGVGKSLIAANLSIALAEAGKRVILIDLDLGGSNLHTLLGIRSTDKGLGIFLNSEHEDLSEVIIKTQYNDLCFIPGDGEIPGIANLTNSQKSTLIHGILDLDADFIILDLGAGTNNNVLDFFLISGHGIVVCTPVLTSILNGYLFLKNAAFRIMTSVVPQQSMAREYLDDLKREGKSLQKIYLPQLMANLEDMDPESYRLFEERFDHFNPAVIFNMLEDPKQAEKSSQLRRSVNEYLGLDLEHLGVIYRDDLQKLALNSRLPVIKYKPNSVLSTAIYRIADKLLTVEDDNGAPLDIWSLEESYQIAEMEARIDYKARLQNIDELLHCRDFTKGDLIETIKNQQFELDKLKKENLLLKTKLKKALEQGFSG